MKATPSTFMSRILRILGLKSSDQGMQRLVEAAQRAMGAKNWVEAARLWRDARDLGKGKASGSIHLNLARALRRSGDLKAAEEVLRQARQLHPSDVKLLRESAMVCAACEQWAEAEALWKEVLSNHESKCADSDYLHHAAALVKSRRHAEASDVVEKGLSKFPESEQLKMCYADLPAEAGDRAGALARWEKLYQEQSSPSARVHARYAKALRRMNAYQKARDVLYEGRGRYPEDAEIAAELKILNATRHGPPEDMKEWEPGVVGTPRVRDAGIIKSRKFRHNIRFLQTCAFSMPFSVDEAADVIHKIDDYREIWAKDPREGRWLGSDKAGHLVQLREHLDHVVKTALQGRSEDRLLTMGLSSGFDSRAILGSLRRLGLKPLTFTFGQIGSSDFDLVKILSEREKLETSFFDTSEMEWSLAELEAFAHYAPSFVLTPRAAINRSLNQVSELRDEINGWLGDALTNGVPKEVLELSWKDCLPVFCRISNRFSLQCFLPEEEVLASLPQEPLIDVSRISTVDQLAIGFGEWQRFRPIDRPNVKHILPFAQPEWIGFWLNRTPEERLEQSLWINLHLSNDGGEFFELQGHPSLTKDEAVELKGRYLYGDGASPGAVDLSQTQKMLPAKHSTHFCAYTCYSNNPAFRNVVETSLARLRKRGIFANDFIDAVVRHFHARSPFVDRMLEGLLNVDIKLEIGFFDET